VLQDLQPKLNGVAGVQAFSFSPPALPGGGFGPPFQFVIKSAGDFRELADVVDRLDQEATKSGLFIFTQSDLKFDTPQIEVIIDRDKANVLGVRMDEIGGTLATLLGGNYVNRFNMQGRSYQVIPQVPRDFRLTPERMLSYQLRSQSGELVPISSFATISQSVQPTALNTFQQLNSATISGVPFPGRSMGEVTAFMEEKAAEILPQGMTFDYQGDSRQFVQEGNTLAVAFVFALIIIYLVLAAQFESFRDPFIILVSLPTAMFGALLPLSFGVASVNIYTQIGLVTLIGLISKHGILMVEFANKLQEEEHLDRRTAIEKAAGVRLRPILMTTAAMVVGMFPLLIAEGAGAKSRFDIGLVIAMGMTVGTIFTLFVTPAVYSLLARDRRVMAGGTAHAGVRDK
jgi:multidrug efflux pump